MTPTARPARHLARLSEQVERVLREPALRAMNTGRYPRPAAPALTSLPEVS
ncbi:hypothetical protein [Deinococcus sp. JMULE3]|uniref:hypothetical protein n=1 Tax=Deinococcus sp. JMULE3 TaxID=2518341 RepID=UPI0015764989|nr:hypothetical protein [Deinococcus sp. JMULE3]